MSLAEALVDLGVAPSAVQLSLERNMRCAVAQCGHCQLGPVLLCRDGPVLRFDRAEQRRLGPDEAREEAQRAIDAGVDIIAPECAVPLQTRVANLKEIVQTCEDNLRL